MERKTEPFVCSHDFITATIISTRFRWLSTHTVAGKLAFSLFKLNYVHENYYFPFHRVEFDLVYDNSSSLLDFVSFNFC